MIPCINQEHAPEPAQIITVRDGERIAVCADCYLHRLRYWPKSVFQTRVLS